MKRKFKEALENFNAITRSYLLGDFIKPLFHVYRAYGYFCLGKHQSSLYDYLAVETLLATDPNSTYNKFLCEGILSVQSGNYETGLTYFQKAWKVFPNKLEPFFYQGVSKIK